MPVITHAVRPTPSPEGAARLFSWKTIFALLVIIPLLAWWSPLQALGPTDVTISMTTAPFFISDSNSPPQMAGPKAAYIGFEICNTSGGVLTDLEATMSNITGTVPGFALAGGQAPTLYLGTLAPGECDVLYWYVEYPYLMKDETGTFELTVSDADPGVVVDSEDVFTRNSISASAGGQVVGSTLGPGIFVGQVFYFDVDYEFGNVQNGDEFTFQPAGNLNFDASCYQLVNGEVLSSDLGGVGIPVGTQDQFYFVASGSMGGSGHMVSVRYYFRSNCVGMGASAQPYAGQTSGNLNFKYTDNFELTDIAIPPSTDALMITKSVSPNLILLPPGQVTYTVTLSNTSDQTIVVDRIDDQLPASFEFNMLDPISDVTAANSTSLPAPGATGSIAWVGGVPTAFPYFSYEIGPLSSIDLVYIVDVPMGTPVGTYDNLVTASMGMYTTPPATTTVGVGVCTVELNCPANITVDNDPGLCTANVSFPDAMANGTCPPIAVLQTQGLSSGSDFPVGISMIQYTATDNNGNSTSCMFTVTVIDAEVPQIACPADILVGNDLGVCTAAVDFSVTGSDNCPGEVIVQTMGLPSGSDFPLGTVMNVFLITDASGNTAMCSFDMTVSDGEAPMPICSDLILPLDLFGNGSIVAADIDGGSSDLCGPVMLTIDQMDFDCTHLGPNTVTLTVTDAAGNSSSCEATVTVEAGAANCDPFYDLAGSSQCECLNNATDQNNGQFAELIQLVGPAGQSWEIASVSGLFDPGSLPPPALPLPWNVGTALTPGDLDGLDNDNDNIVDEADEQIFYTLQALHVEGQGYAVSLTNESGDMVEVENLCFYPTLSFPGLNASYCTNEPAFVLTAEEVNGAAGTLTILIDGLPNDLFDPAQLGVGIHIVTAIFDAGQATGALVVDGLPAGPTAQDALLDPGCIQELELGIEVSGPSNVLACNPLITIGLDIDCVSLVTQDMVLEGEYSCIDLLDVILHYPPATTQFVPPNLIDSTHVGYTFPYTVLNPETGNSCNGFIAVEDNIPPVIECPADLQILCNQDPDDLSVTGQPLVIDCSPWQAAYTDQLESFLCEEDPFLSARITRSWIVTDVSGNATTCTQMIEILRGDLEQVTFPDDVSYSCLNVPGSLEPPVTGWPQIAGIDLLPAGDIFCGIEVTYVDEVFEDCPGMYLIVRSWTLYDFCPPDGSPFQSLTVVQNIEVNDEPPVLTIGPAGYDPQNDWWVLSANGIGSGPDDACGSYGPLPEAIGDGVCNEISSIVVFTPLGIVPSGGILPAPGLPLGPHQLTYVATDECGNQTQLTITVYVEDDVPPTMVCDEITDVDLTNNGEAIVPAEVFADGVYDNCCLSHFEVRRLEGDCDGNYDDFGPTVTFCCSDVGNGYVSVILRAYDCEGNYNDCEVQVEVNDKLPPVLLFCPPDLSISCEEYLSELAFALEQGDYSVLDQYGESGFLDNCSTDSEYEVTVDIDNCASGTIVRTWTADDPSGNAPIVCTQVITVEQVSDWVVEFPPDLTGNCEDGQLPEFGEPQIFFDECELIAVSYEDTYFYVVPDACFKVVRTWTVINWCIFGQYGEEVWVEIPECELTVDWDGDGDADCRTYRDGWNDSGTPGTPDGYIQHAQIVKVIDDEAPVVTVEDLEVCFEDADCNTDVVLPEPEVMDCSAGVTIAIETNLPNPTPGDPYSYSDVPPGDYEVIYTVSDQCGNTTYASIEVTVKDCKAPTPYCNELITEIMQTGMVPVSAWQFDAGSFDNCPGDLLLSFSENVSDTVKIYTCGQQGIRIVTIWVTDAAGNQAFCETTVDIQDNMEVCFGVPDIVIVSGLIATEAGEPLEEAVVDVNGALSQTTLADGFFAFELETLEDYTITPSLDAGPANGVTTYDLVLITRHILGVEPLGSPYQLIAADANRSGAVTTLDLVDIRKVILLLVDHFPNNTSWRFVDADHVFVNPFDPWQGGGFPEVINYNDLEADDLGADFVAVKIGDVNGTAQANSQTEAGDRQTQGTWPIAFERQSLGEDRYEWTVAATAAELLGFQFALGYDPELLEIEEVRPALLQPENLGRLPQLDALTVSWHQAEPYSFREGEVLFRLIGKTNMGGNPDELFSLRANLTAAEAYGPGKILGVGIRSDQGSAAGFHLFQNVPNPFRSSTTIAFQLPEAGPATLTITDVSGKVVRVLEGEYSAGFHEVELRDLNATGLLYYQLSTPSYTATRRMIRLR